MTNVDDFVERCGVHGVMARTDCILVLISLTLYVKD